jgi:hypothetical protein
MMGILALTGACQGRGAAEHSAPTAASARLAVPQDFEEAAERQITADNLEEQLKQLEAEVTKDP